MGDLSYINTGRRLEVENIDGGRSLSELTMALNSNGLAQADEGATEEEEAINGKPVDDVMESDEQLRDLPPYVKLAEAAFRQRGLTYPFEIDDSREALAVKSGMRDLAKAAAELSRVVSFGNSEARKFEKRAFIALHKLIGGWGVCVGAPRNDSTGPKKAIEKYRGLLLEQERGTQLPAQFAPNGDHGADGFFILGRGWGGPLVFYQSKNTGFDLRAHPEEFGRIPSIVEDWFGRKLTSCRRVVPVLALNTVLTVELKQQIYEDRGQDSGVHIIDAVDILAAELLAPDHESVAGKYEVF